MGHDIYLVDVFAQDLYAGNPLAVVVGERALPDETMQKIAAEINYSETTFVQKNSGPDGSYQVRIFTPSREIEFAGHPLLGTAWVILNHLSEEPCDRINLDIKAGKIPVVIEQSETGENIVWFDSPPVSFGRICDVASVAKSLGISLSDIDKTLPIQEMSAGTSAIIVPLKSLEVLGQCKLDLDEYRELSEQGYPPLVYLFCPQTRSTENDLSARFFFEANGVREDPATGNGAAFLGAYLRRYSYPEQKGFILRIEQGHEVRRPSVVLISSQVLDGESRIRVGGRVIPTIQGKLL